MIKNQWYVVLESNEVKKGLPLGVTRLGEKLVFWRSPDDKVVCMRDQCPHLGAALHQGQIKGGQLTCPFHGFEFDSSGACCYLPAYGRKGIIPKALKAFVYPTHEAHGYIWIYWSDEPDKTPAAPRFFDAFDRPGLSYIRFRQHWPTHYSRMCENQLDVMHLPFVHATTIGRGNHVVVDGPYVKLEGDLLHVWVYNRDDDGTPARRMEDLPEPIRRPFLEFRFPNLWHNWISDDVHISAAFVPVDEENSLFYGRFYQGFMQIPLLREAANLAGKYSSLVIANQDYRVVINQRPKRTDLKMGEKITQSDRAILTYRQHRRELMTAAGQVEKG
jgi:phenylpropionate dioxygenase-like ring-hydroxylating dioxygenase large terminal subunit